MICCALPGPDGAAWTGAASPIRAAAKALAATVAIPNFFILEPSSFVLFVSEPWHVSRFAAASNLGNRQVYGFSSDGRNWLPDGSNSAAGQPDCPCSDGRIGPTRGTLRRWIWTAFAFDNAMASRVARRSPWSPAPCSIRIGAPRSPNRRGSRRSGAGCMPRSTGSGRGDSGATPCGMRRALTEASQKSGVRYRWRFFRGRRDALADVLRVVAEGWPVPMLVGRFIPRHWVLIVGTDDARLECYEPTFGDVCTVGIDSLGYCRPFAFVRPYSNV